jgi:HlyD family secretion protein
MQVYAKTDESDVGQIKPGQAVTFRVDAFPKDRFSGRVMQVRMNPTTVQNVVTYDTIVEFANPEMKLFPGMTAYVDIPVASAQGVLKVPNGALRYKPSLAADEIARLYQQNGINVGARRGQGQQDTSNGAAAQRWRQRQQQQQQSGETPGGGVAAKPEARESTPDVAVVWKLLPDKSIAPVQIRTGITDHTYTELAQVLAGKLQLGDQLVIGAADVNRTAGQRPMQPGTGLGGAPRTPR